MKTEKSGLKSETVIFLNPNQVILVREAQKKLCAAVSELHEAHTDWENFLCVPTLPLCIRGLELKNLGDKITKAEPCEFFFENGRIFLSVRLEINGTESHGKIELCKIYIEESESNGMKSEPNLEAELSSPRFDTENFLAIKKFSPFRICEMESEDFDKGVTWKILREKWGKIR